MGRAIAKTPNTARLAAVLLASGLLLAGRPAARAVPLTDIENLDHSVNLDGSFKSFFHLMHFPQYPADVRTLMGGLPERGGLALVDLRLKAEGTHHERYKWGIHLRTQPQFSSFEGALESLSFASAARPVRALPLQYVAPQDETLRWNHEVDRLFFQVRYEKLTVIVGRQPISFGVGFVWKPADLVGTFSPVELDQEYKPGVDALRLNFALGRFTELAVVGAFGGPGCVQRTLPGRSVRDRLPDGSRCKQYEPQFALSHSVLMTRFRTTVKKWDLGAEVGWVRGDVVGGLFVTGTIERLRLRTEVTYTWDVEVDAPDAEGLLYAGSGNALGRDNHFARAVVGMDYRFDTEKNLVVLAELYYQGLGRRHPRDYLGVAQKPRMAEFGEVFNLGLLYAAAGVNYEPHERVPLSLTVMGNLLDPSMLVSATVTWKVGDNSMFVAGALIPVGKGPVLDLDAPQGLRARSEFGFYPYVYYLQWKLYW